LKVKVCGITSYRDASMALSLGADALGFNFYPRSPRYIAPAAARRIVDRLPPFVTKVAVYVNADDLYELVKGALSAGVDVLQLHGDETPEYCCEFDHWKLIKTLHIGEGFLPEDLEKYPVSAFLLDTRNSSLYGGTGKTFDWKLAGTIRTKRPLILAGGLCAENVADAIRTVRPYAVDVCSSVESAPGKKERRKLVAFMNEVHRASRDIDG
jgi:phosphoribosylanthranilate isomerase